VSQEKVFGAHIVPYERIEFNKSGSRAHHKVVKERHDILNDAKTKRAKEFKTDDF
jgi:hypothetical protein